MTLKSMQNKFNNSKQAFTSTPCRKILSFYIPYEEDAKIEWGRCELVGVALTCNVLASRNVGGADEAARILRQRLPL